MNKIKTNHGILLSASLLLKLNFKLVKVENNPFESIKMPYYVKDGIVLFFNEGESNKNSFYAGYAEMRAGKYYAVAFRWIERKQQLLDIFKAIRGFELLEQ